MNHRVSSIRNLRTITALRGDSISIDLGQTFLGTLKSWMKKKPNSEYYRAFEIIDNRYLRMPKEKTVDYVDGDGCMIEAIAGKWYFDVEQEVGEDCKTIYTGTILFINDITCSNGQELFSTDTQSIFDNNFNNIFS